MLPDPFHYRRALAPQGLRTIATVNAAIQEAIANAVNLGIDPASCPAIGLLMRHQLRIANNSDIDITYPEDAHLRAACETIIADIETRPMLSALHQVARLSDESRNHLIREAKAQLRDLARCFALTASDYDLRVAAHPGITPEITLHTDCLYIRVAQPFVPGNDVLYRKVRSRTDYIGLKNHWATITALEQPAQFAHRLTQDLQLNHAVH